MVRIHGQLCSLSGTKLYPKNEKYDFLIIVSFNAPKKVLQEYKKRWQVEVCCETMKLSEFNIEYTHLQDIERIQKLVLLVMIALLWCHKMGIYLHKISPHQNQKIGKKG